MGTSWRATGRLLAAAAFALTALAGCNADGSDQPAYDGPTTLQPAEPSTADGVRRVSCQLGESAVSLVLDLPREFKDVRRPEEGDCAWTRKIRPKQPNTYSHYTETVTVSRVGDDDTLAKIEEERKPFVDIGGDDSISELELSEGVASIGATAGDRLGWNCFCDGQGTLTRLVQADGVRVGWYSLGSEAAEVDRLFDQALAGAGTARK